MGGISGDDLGTLSAQLQINMDQLQEAFADGKVSIQEFERQFAALGAAIKQINEIIAESSRATTDTELANYRSLLEAERIQHAALAEEFRLKQDMAALTNRLREEELAGIRAQNIATTVGYEQEAAYRKAMLAEAAASDTEYAALKERLRAEELAGQEAIMDEILADIRAHERLRLELVAAEREAEVAITRAAAKQQIEAQRELQANITGTSYLLGGYAGARVANAATKVNPAVVAGVGGALGIYELTKFTIEAERAAQKTRDFAEATGLSWEQARRLEEYAAIAGISVNSLEQAAGRMAVAFDSSSSAGKDIVKALGEMGVVGSSSGEILANFLQKLSEIPSQTERIAEARRVLGRGSADIESLVSQLVEVKLAAKEAGGSLTEDMGEGLSDAARKVRTLELAWTHFKEGLAVSFGPTLSTVSNGATNVLRLDQMVTSLMGSAASSNQGALGFNPVKVFLDVFDAYDRVSAKKREDSSSESKGNDAHAAELAKLRDLAVSRQQAHARTLEGMREELVAQKAIVAENEKILFNVVKPATQNDAGDAERKATSARARIEELQYLIKEAEGKIDKKLDTEQGRMYDQQVAVAQARLRHKIAEYDIAHPEPFKQEGQGQLEFVVAKVNYGLDRLKFVHDETEKTLHELSALDPGARAGKADNKVPAQIQDNNDQYLINRNKLLREQHAEEAKFANDNAKRDEAFEEQQTRKKIQLEADFQKAVENYVIERSKDEERAEQITLAAKEDHTKRLAQMERDDVDFQRKMGLITEQEKVAALSRIDAAAEESEKADIDRQRAAIGLKTFYNSEELSQLAELDRKEQAISDKTKARKQRDQEELKRGSELDKQIAAERGKLLDIGGEQGGSSKALQYETLKIQIDLATASMRGFGGVAADVLGQIYSDFGKLGGILGALFTEPHKKFKQEFGSFVKGIEKEMISVISGDLLKLGIGKVLDKVGIHPAANPADIQKHADAVTSHIDSMANTREDAANTTAVNANTAAIEALTAAINREAAAASSSGSGSAKKSGGGLGSFLGGLLGGVASSLIPGLGILHLGGGQSGSSSYAEGGDAMTTGFHKLERGEHVLTPDISTGLRKMMATGSLNGGGGDMHLHLEEPHFHGHFSDEEIDHIGNRLVKRARRTGAPA